MLCPNCGTDISRTGNFCPYCGAEFTVGTINHTNYSRHTPADFSEPSPQSSSGNTRTEVYFSKAQDLAENPTSSGSVSKTPLVASQFHLAEDLSPDGTSKGKKESVRTDVRRSCPACGRDVIGDGKFCPHCGENLTSAGQKPKKGHSRFTKMAFTAIGITAAIVIVLAVVYIKGSQPSRNWEKMIRGELLSGSSAIEVAMADIVDISAKEEGGKLTVTLSAPDISAQLLDWMEHMPEEEFTEEQLEKEILRLLDQTDKVSTTHELSYSEEQGTVTIAYTQDFGSELSCGLSRFYAEMTRRVLEELGEGAT